MFRRIFLAAVAAGLLVGAITSVVQHFTTTPLILRAEVFERASDAAIPHEHGHGAAADAPGRTGQEAQATPSGRDHQLQEPRTSSVSVDWERLLFTTLANLLVGVGFALLVVAALAWRGAPVDAKTGLAWGAAGFVVVTLAPALGLPPEPPGLIAADITARQLWWVSAVGAAAVGLALLVFGRSNALKVCGVAIAMLPQVVGAPHPEAVGAGVPPELASQFAASSIVVSAIFWTLLGWLSAVFYRRFDETA
jgi:cobalt transporter subunit CbtA